MLENNGMLDDNIISESGSLLLGILFLFRQNTFLIEGSLLEYSESS